MEHINYMGYSLRTMENLIRLSIGTEKNFLPNVEFWCDYPFLDARPYFVSVKDKPFFNPVLSSENFSVEWIFRIIGDSSRIMSAFTGLIPNSAFFK